MTSTSAESSFSYEPKARGTENCWANCLAEASRREPTATISVRRADATPAANCCAMFPVPRIPHRSFASTAVLRQATRCGWRSGRHPLLGQHRLHLVQILVEGGGVK